MDVGMSTRVAVGVVINIFILLYGAHLGDGLMTCVRINTFIPFQFPAMPERVTPGPVPDRTDHPWGSPRPGGGWRLS